MSVPAWFFPASGAVARGFSIAPYGAGVAVADWLTPTVWPFAGSAFLPGITLATGTPGISAITADSASGIWAITFGGTLFHVAAVGTASSGQMPSGAVYISCATSSGMVLSSDGVVRTSGGVTLGSWPVPAFDLASSGTTLAALLPASGLGTMNASNGVTGLIAFPAGLTTPSSLCMLSGPPVAVAGWQTAPVLSGAVAAALNPTDQTSMAAVGSGRAIVWRAPAALSDAWSQSQALTGLANLSALGWTPDGFHVLATSTVSGAVQVLGYAAGVLSLTQTLTVSGACSVAVAGDSLHALVAQSGQSQLATLTFGGTWATGSPVTGLPGISSVVPFGLSGAVAAYGSGLAYISLGSGGWGISSTVPLASAATAVTLDPFGVAYAVGSGALYVVSPSGATTPPALFGSGSWVGGKPTGLAVQEGRVVIAVPTDNKYYIFGQSLPNSWTQQTSGSLALGTTVGLGLSATTLFMLGSGSTVTWGFSGTQFILTPVLSGVVAQRSGGSWTTTPLGVGHTPSACTYDVSGNLTVLTTQNTVWSITSGGTALSTSVMQPYTAQNINVPLSLSAALLFGGSVYVATSIPGSLAVLGASTSTNLINDAGVLALISASGWPVTGTGSPGSLWSNGGVVSVVSGSIPNPLALPVFFGSINSSTLLALGGQNLPITAPTSGSLQLWNNIGEVNIA